MTRLKWFRWFVPGLNIKRWLTLFGLGVGAVIFGLSLMLNYQWISFFEDLVLQYSYLWFGVYDYAVLVAVGVVAIALGTLCMLVGTSKVIKTIIRAIIPEGEGVGDIIFQNMRLQKGPKVVVIGGGTGLSNLLRGLKSYTNNLTAIVTVADDGGSSGRLREDFNMIAPGDLRNCLVALADTESLMENLFQYRFSGKGELSGHSFGNLFLTALTQVYENDVEEALEAASKILKVRGRVIPASTEFIKLSAELEDGTIVHGESNIPHGGSPIKRVFSSPLKPTPEGAALQAIDEADAIILGPGSLYTSIIPNLLIKKIAVHLRASKVPKIYVCNVMTQPGETDGYSVADHIEAIERHGGRGLINTVLVNESTMDQELLKTYEKAGQGPVAIDMDRLSKKKIRTVRANLVSSNNRAIHDHDRLGKVLMDIIYALKTDIEPHVLESYLERNDH